MVNPKVTKITVPALNGGFVAINLTAPETARAAVQEDPSNAGFGQGLVGYYVDPSIATKAVMDYFTAQGSTAAQVLAGLIALGALTPNVLQKWLAGSGLGQAYQPIELGDWLRIHAGYGEGLGAAGACVLLLTSAGATATGVLLTEWK